jgi:hypothetical protein
MTTYRKLFISSDYKTWTGNYIAHELLLYRKNNPTKMSFEELHSDTYLLQLKQIKTLFLWIGYKNYIFRLFRALKFYIRFTFAFGRYNDKEI